MQIDTHTSKRENLEKRNRELAILNAIAEALNRSVNLDQALQAALGKVTEVFGLQTGWIWLIDDLKKETYLAAAQNLPPALVQHPELMQGSCYCLDTYQAGDMAGAANVNVITCSRLKKVVDGTAGLRYHASVPLNIQDRQLGVLNVASIDWRELTENDLRMLYTVGDMLSIAIERARLFSRSVEMGALEERNRLARDIHDTLAQSLTGITLQLETAEALLEAGAETQSIHRAISRALSLARASLEEARRSVLDLRAAPLEGRSLAQALRELVDTLSAQHGLHINYRATGDGHTLPSHLEEGLYRICQEALANIVQHAHTSHAWLRLSVLPDHVRLEIDDRGVGFNLEEIPSGHYGLVGLNERARLLGGEARIESCPGEGTRIKVSVPISPTRGRSP